MAKDVFISYATCDKAIADKLCMVLEELGLDCWIAPRDIPPGTEFDVAILDGIHQCQASVVLLSSEANASPFVKNEVNRAFSRGIPILTFRVQEIKPAKALEFYLARHQWTDGFPPPVEERIARMARALLELLGRTTATLAAPAKPIPKSEPPTKTLRFKVDWTEPPYSTLTLHVDQPLFQDFPGEWFRRGREEEGCPELYSLLLSCPGIESVCRSSSYELLMGKAHLANFDDILASFQEALRIATGIGTVLPMQKQPAGRKKRK